MITETYTRIADETNIEVEINESPSFAEVDHIINETVKASFDDVGNYVPFVGEGMKWALILNLFTNIDPDTISTLSDVYSMLNTTTIAMAVVDALPNTMHTIDKYVASMVDVKLHESPLKPMLKLLGSLSDQFSNVDIEKAITSALKDEEIRKSYLSLQK